MEQKSSVFYNFVQIVGTNLNKSKHSVQFQMTKEMKNELLHYLNFQKSIGIDYHDGVNLIDNSNINRINLPSDLNQLKKIVENCFLCELSKGRKNTVFSDGNAAADLMFIGDVPGTLEDETGTAFVGRSGELLTKMIENVLKVSRNDVYVTNIIKCKPIGSKSVTQNEVKICKSYILKQIELVNPKLIVFLGENTFNYMMQEEVSISKVRGQVLSFNGRDMITTYHPSYLLRNPSAKKEVYFDMLKIKELMEL